MPLAMLELSRFVFVARRALRSRTLAAALVMAAAFQAASPAEAAEIFVSPSGSPKNNGTQARPIDLTTALSRTSPARPGDTIWLLDGTYVGNFKSYLTGTPEAPITVKQYPGARATLDGAGSPDIVLEVFGAWAIYWGFEVTNSSPGRDSSQTGPWPSDLPRGHGIFSWGPNIKFVNLILHDLQSGIGLWTESVGSEIYGSLVYHNGWQAPDRSHGHGIYTQNRTATRLVRENIIFNQFSHGIHAYASDAAFIDNITLEGNVSFNNGILGRDGFARDLLLGGGVVANNPVLRENFTYGGGQSNLGYGAGCANGQATGNYLVGAAPLLLLRCTPTLAGNTFYSHQATRWGWAPLDPRGFPLNAYFARRPSANVVRVRPNAFEAGRGHVVIYNWTGEASVDVDLTAIGLAAGDDFEIRDAQDFFGPPVVSGIYSGAPVTIAMTGLSLSPPIGEVPVIPAHTAPEFAVFVVLRSGPASENEREIAATPVISPAGGTFTEPVTVSLTTGSAAATIRYTTDNSLPTASSPIYTEPFVMSVSGSVQARSFAPDLLDSEVAVAAFTVGAPSPAAAPTINPPGGTFSAPIAVSIASGTDGATIRYTTDGSDPGATSPIYSGPIVLGGNVTVKARAFAAPMHDSPVTSADFVVATPPQSVPPPDISPAGGTFSVSAVVTLRSAYADAVVRFTTDGSVPDADSPVYTNPLVLTSSAVVQARAFIADLSPSPVATSSFALRDSARPKVSAAAVRDVSPTSVTVSWSTNEPADSGLLFFWHCPGACTSSAPALVTDHSMTVTGLRPHATYTLQIWSRDAAGNVGTSNYLTFRTPR